MTLTTLYIDRKCRIPDLICRRSTPKTNEGLLPLLLNFILESLEELDRIDYSFFDLSHTETVQSLCIDLLVIDIRAAIALAGSCLHEIQREAVECTSINPNDSG
jgi:hypothetical protein